MNNDIVSTITPNPTENEDSLSVQENSTIISISEKYTHEEDLTVTE
jgi:hypothetical protein